MQTGTGHVLHPPADHFFSVGGNSMMWWPRLSMGITYLILKSGSEQVDSSLFLFQKHRSFFMLSVLAKKKKKKILGRNDVPDSHKWQKLHTFSQGYT